MSAISMTGIGSQYLPSAATVAYALASSSGTVSVTPMVNGPNRCDFFGSEVISRSFELR